MPSQDAKNPNLRIGSKAPNFQAESTRGKIDLYEYIGKDWAILLAHPKQNPVSSTELAIFQALLPEFDKRNVKLLALIPDTPEATHRWIKEIEAVSGTEYTIPIIADTDRKISFQYDMLDHDQAVDKKSPQSVRGVFIIDHANKVRLVFSYPKVVGINTDEVIRTIDCLQTCDASDVMTPVNWNPGCNVLVNPEKMNHNEAQEKFDNLDTIHPNAGSGFLVAPLAAEDTSAPITAA